MSKDLLIVVDHVDLKSIDLSLLKRCDKLAITTSAMLVFEQSKLSYLTFEDFYNHKQFRVDNNKLIKGVENLFFKLDKKYRPFLGFPRAFTANIYWFLALFANCCYISRICQKIKRNYDKIYFVGDPKYKALFRVGLEFSPEGLSFSKFNNGLDSKVSMLRSCLSSKCIWIDNSYCKHSKFNIKRLRYLFKKLFRRILQRISFLIQNCINKKKGNIFVIQDGYEVGLLKRYISEVSFINPNNKLLSSIKNENLNKSNIKMLFTEELEKFISEWFPDFKVSIFNLFEIYHSRVLCYLNSFIDKLNILFNFYQPNALFYSIFSSNIYEDLFAFVANQKNIPIFYFQHGGVSMFCKHPYQKFTELNKNIKKINIFYSSNMLPLSVKKDTDKDSYFDAQNALGSIKLYRYYCSISKASTMKRKNNRRVLYCPGIFNSFNYKDLMFNVPDKELFAVNKDVVNAISKFWMKMDIKVHPSDDKHFYLYFNNLLKSLQIDNFGVLRRFPAEEIIKNYGLLILDYIASALVPTSIVLNIPVILYLKDSSFLREEVIADIERQFYVVRNKSELDRCLSLYQNDKLDTKIYPEVIDKYIFPFKNGDPGINIANYIRSNIFK